MQYTPMVDRRLHYYNVDLLAISLNGQTLPASQVNLPCEGSWQPGGTGRLQSLLLLLPHCWVWHK